MTHEEALEYWSSRVNYERTSPRAQDLSLDRIRHFLAALGDPQDQIPVIHIAGSKGKGSTAAMLARVLHAAGYRTGLFTSPHLSRAEERIRMNGEPIGALPLAGLMEEIAATERRFQQGRKPFLTFFEIGTALGYLHFARERADIAVVEVGLGGRFDATNVCRPILAVITTISYDHTAQLGGHLASIAKEKAGIIKQGCPVISGARAREARAVLEYICQQRSAGLRLLDRDFSFRYTPPSQLCRKSNEFDSRHEAAYAPSIEVTTEHRRWPSMQLGLVGEHQAANAAVVVASIEELSRHGWRLPDLTVEQGLAHPDWPARVEMVSAHPAVVVDCAHTLGSALALLNALEGLGAEARRCLIFGGSADKDLVGMLKLMMPHFRWVYLTRFSSSLRAADVRELESGLALKNGISVQKCATAEEAWRQALHRAGTEGLVCVAGSVFLAGELRPLILRDLRDLKQR